MTEENEKGEQQCEEQSEQTEEQKESQRYFNVTFCRCWNESCLR